MFNVTIIKLKDLIKYLLALTMITIVVLWARGYFFDNNKEKASDKLNKKDYIFENNVFPLNVSMPVINSINKIKSEENIEENDGDFLSKSFSYILGSEFEVIEIISKINDNKNEKIEVAEKSEINQTKEVEETNLNNNTNENNIEEKNEENEEIKTNINTEVVTENPLKDNVTNNYKGVKIKNETNYELTDEILNYDNINIDKTNIIIFHTHTCESYTSSEQFAYMPTGNFRTTDLNYSVVKVGDELSKCLSSYGINVIHSNKYHDYPAYTGSYSRSLSTVSSILKETKADIIIDLHRDAIGNYSSYAPTVKIGNEYCAQIMFVIGTNGGGLYHPNWQSNLKWAVSIQDKANKMYPGLFKTMILRNSRYNQHLGKAACIIEVGATGNTLEQCLNSMKYLAKAITN